ncbi:NAD-dependent epimerase/dehydratase family protein [Methanomicrobium mobile]|uniref:NAD-dependent epimerase/dehydratase family protein n=1 Tax=Methanomicrobium mobile TaxID=2205 RepID=UPI0005B27B67|nr:NAD(P)-dependent oxidoreductase [Methanomicrobium mobile]
MAKYFITGGAGFLGINLTRYLLEKGNTVVSYDISKEYDYPEKEDPRVTVISGDIRDYEPMKNAMNNCEIVVHTAAALPLYKKEDIFSTDIDGSRNVLLAAKANGISRVIQISSTAVYGIPDHHPLLETDKLDGVGPYGVAKIEAEKTCAEFRKEGMIVPIIRPKSFVGPERLGVFVLLYDWAQDGRGFPMIGSGNNRYQLLDVYDLCSAIYLCATLDNEIVNDTFNIGAEVFTTMREDYQAVLDKAGFGKKVIGFPKKPIIWSLRFLEFLHLSPLYKWVYETAGEESFVSIEKAKKQLGWKPIYSNKDALLRNFEWYLQHKDEFKNKSGVSHRVPWKQGILSIAKRFF